MHFVNRSEETRPLNRINQLKARDQALWVTYNQARREGLKPLPAKPSSGWLESAIRDPLKALFYKNCGYCGIHTDSGYDAEVDHYFPTSKDDAADLVYDWENYVWACPACNGLKSDHYYVLNPCNPLDMQGIYFHSYDGCYFPKTNVSDDLRTKYKMTVSQTFINGKNRPGRRKIVYIEVKNQLKFLNQLYQARIIETSKQDKDSADVISLTISINEKRNFLVDLIKAGDYLRLIDFVISDFIKEEGVNIPFTFKELLDESLYLIEEGL